MQKLGFIKAECGGSERCSTTKLTLTVLTLYRKGH